MLYSLCLESSVPQISVRTFPGFIEGFILILPSQMSLLDIYSTFTLIPLLRFILTHSAYYYTASCYTYIGLFGFYIVRLGFLQCKFHGGRGIDLLTLYLLCQERFKVMSVYASTCMCVLSE